jgi:hypothetical protein
MLFSSSTRCSPENNLRFKKSTGMYSLLHEIQMAKIACSREQPSVTGAFLRILPISGRG